VGNADKIPLYPEIVKCDELKNIEMFISEKIKPKSVKDGYYIATALEENGVKILMVGIGKEDDSISNQIFTNDNKFGWLWVEGEEIEPFISTYGETLSKEVILSSKIREEKYKKRLEIEAARLKAEELTNKENSLKGRVWVDVVKVGDYIEYVPDLTEYVVKKSDSGVNENQIFRSNEEKLWQVLSNDNKNLTITLKSGIGNLKLKGNGLLKIKNKNTQKETNIFAIEEILFIDSNYILLKKEGKYFQFDDEGREIREYNHDFISKVADKDMFIVSEIKSTYRKYGLLNKYGEEVISCDYDDIENFIGDYAIIQKNGLYGVVNTNGEIIIDCDYDGLYVGMNNVLTAKKDSEYYIITLK